MKAFTKRFFWNKYIKQNYFITHFSKLEFIETWTSIYLQLISVQRPFTGNILTSGNKIFLIFHGAFENNKMISLLIDLLNQWSLLKQQTSHRQVHKSYRWVKDDYRWVADGYRQVTDNYRQVSYESQTTSGIVE